MQVWKRILSCALVGACVLLPVNQFNELTDVFAAEESTEPAVWDGTYDISWYDDEMAEMHISTAEELAGLAQLVQTGRTMTGKTFILDSDIVLNDVTNFENWDTESPLNSWVPIGGNSDGFEGTFDGNGHTITGLYDSSSGDDTWSSRGLFGELYPNGLIKNVICDYGYVSHRFRATYSTDKSIYTGGICGSSYGGTIINCHFNGQVKTSNNITCTKASSALSYTGGICGYSKDSNIVNCSNNGTVIVSSTITPESGTKPTATVYSIAGGICGELSNSKIINCKNTGEISATATSSTKGTKVLRDWTGGICGYLINESYIENCYNHGVMLEGSSAGIAGYAEENSHISNVYNIASGVANGVADCFHASDITIEKCYYLSGSALSDKGGATAKNKTNMQSSAFAETLGNAFVYVEGDYPKLYWELGLALRGDVNNDSFVTVADVVMLQQYLLNIQSLDEKQFNGALITDDDAVNGFDLAVLKRMILIQ